MDKTAVTCDRVLFIHGNQTFLNPPGWVILKKGADLVNGEGIGLVRIDDTDDIRQICFDMSIANNH